MFDYTLEELTIRKTKYGYIVSDAKGHRIKGVTEEQALNQYHILHGIKLYENTNAIDMSQYNKPIGE